MTDDRHAEVPPPKSLRERLADFVLFAVTAAEVMLLLRFVPSFTITDSAWRTHGGGGSDPDTQCSAAGRGRETPRR